jgi:hypothetical protein
MNLVKEPYVPKVLVDFLSDKIFTLDYLLSRTSGSAEETLGYIKGVRAVIGKLKAMSEVNDDE